METKQVQNFNSNKVNVSLNEIISSKFVFALNEIDTTLSYSIRGKSTICKSYQSKSNRINQNRLLVRTVENVYSTTSICDMIKFKHRPQRRKVYLKRFYGCKKPLAWRDSFNKNDAIKGHPYEINSIASKFKNDLMCLLKSNSM